MIRDLKSELDQALQAELQAVIDYRAYLHHSSEAWSGEQMQTLLDLHKAKNEAHDKADKLLSQWHDQIASPSR